MSDERTPYPKNAPGPFYVVNGCCLFCMAPHQHAPNLMGFDESDNHCFVKRQPLSDEELYSAIRAVWSAELQCLRYGGHDPLILRRLVEIGAAEVCDRPPPPDAAVLLRNHVTFEAAFASEAWDVATAYRDYVLSQNSERVRFKAKPLVREGEEVSFAYSWYEDDYYTLRTGRGEPQTARWLVRHSREWKPGSLSISLMIDDWLRGDARFGSIRWYGADEWRSGGEGWQEKPC